MGEFDIIEERREITNYTHTDLDTSILGEQTITITYTEGIITKTAPLKLKVEPLPKVLDSITVEYIGPSLTSRNNLVKDYIKVLCKGLTDEQIDWLYSITNGNIFRIRRRISR